MQAVIDVEANGLKPTEIYCVVCRDIDTKEVFQFEAVSKDPTEFLDFASRVSTWIGHNIIGFDLPSLRRVLERDASNVGCAFNSDWFSDSRAIDTLVISRFLNVTIPGGHSLEAWGNRFGIQKSGTDISDWSRYDPSMLQRCVSDTAINLRLYEYQLPYIQRDSLRRALRIEHEAAIDCRELSDNGFEFDYDTAVSLKNSLSIRLQEIDKQLVSSFPSSVVLLKEFTPKATLKGTLTQKDFFWIPKEYRHDLSFFKSDTEYSLLSIQPFNPGSLKQIIDRLWDAGWKPTEKTKGHIDFLKERTKDPEKLASYQRYGWKVSDENLLTLPDTAPVAAKRLVERILIASRVSDLEEWLGAAQAVTEGPSTSLGRGSTRYRIHGRFNPIGAWTQRMSHNSPNMANIPKEKQPTRTEVDKLSNEINNAMRRLWIVPRGKRLVGTDADGIQMRIFAHYVNDERLIQSLISGNKKNDTDIHSLNRKALGPVCKSRDDAKTFIYAFLLGAGVSKVSQILGCSIEEAKRATTEFLEFYPGLKDLKQSRIPQDAARGFFYGVDNRPVICDNTHLMLAGYLQNGEVVVMKYARRIWRDQLIRENIPHRFVNFVHDEWQTEVPDDDDVARYVGECQVSAIIQAGLDLNLNCPLNGETKIGYNWQETH
jgi:DNA polymerase I